MWKVLWIQPKSMALFLHRPKAEQVLNPFASACMLVTLASHRLLDIPAECIRIAATTSLGDQTVLMRATEWTVGNPVVSPELQEWWLALCGLCTMVPLARQSELPTRHNALDSGGEQTPHQRSNQNGGETHAPVSLFAT